MADCGATGSALDRAVTRVVLGVGNHYHGLSDILTTATTATSSSSATITMAPASLPEYLPPLVVPFSTPPSTHGARFTHPHQEQSLYNNHQNMESKMLASQMPAAGTGVRIQTAAPTTRTIHQYEYQPQQQHHHHHHQQHPYMMRNVAPTLSETMSQPQRMMMQMQQQQQALMGMMLQQQQHKQQMKQQQQQLPKEQARSGAAAVTTTSTTLEGDHELGVEGSARHQSIQELANAWKEATTTTTTSTDDDEVPAMMMRQEPASIQELSEAWWEANQDWQAVADELGGFYGLDELGNPETYEFHNKTISRTTTTTDADADETTIRNNNDYMEEGMRHFRAGDIRDAIRAFEMELQQQPIIGGGDNTNVQFAKAWRMLGRCHAEQDMDGDAILCLEQAVEVDPYNVAARLELGVSYVNELRYDRALEQLKAWVTHNPQLLQDNVVSSSSSSSSILADDIYGSSEDTLANGPFDEVQRLLLGALSSTTESQTLADIYTALGVVYNVSRDYDAAIDAFKRAITCCMDYDDDDNNNKYQLFNKLGATLANHDQSEQALVYYRQALEIKPKYARAWLNRAISYANLQQYEQAAACYVHTLVLNPLALHCWSYLRTAIACCAEQDALMPLVTERNLEALRTHFGVDMP